MALQDTIYQDLSKGSNLVTNPYVIGKSQNILLTNLLLDEHGSLRTRDGTLIQTTSPDVAPNVRPIVKLYNFIQQSGNVVHIAIVQGLTGNNQLYDRSTTPWTLLGTLGTKYAIPDTLTFTNLMLIANGYEVPYSFDGAALIHLVGTGGGNIVPAGACHHTLHQGFYWVWNTNPTTTTADGPSSLRSSDLNNPNSWPAANQIFVDKDDGDSGQGMGQFTIAESGISPTTSQILFKQFKAFQMTGVFGSTTPAFAIQKVKSDMGCVAPRTIKFAPGFGLIRLTHRGFALFDGVQDTMISEEVRPLIFGTPVQEPVDWARITTAYAVVIPNPPTYAAFVPVCGGTGLTRVFTYDLVRKGWTVLTYPLPIATAETITIPSLLPVFDTTGFGRQWALEPDDRTNNVFPAASIYITDLSVFAFSSNHGVGLQYDVSSDGGVTWPTVRATASAATNDVTGARSLRLSDGTLRIMLLINDSVPGFAFSDNVLTLPTASTWTFITFPGAASSPFGFELNGLNVVAAYGTGGPNFTLGFSTDGGVTWTQSTTNPTGTATTPFGTQTFASPVAGTWFFLNPNDGKIWTSTDSGANWSGPVKTITAGDASLPKVAAIFTVSATRVVACYQGQVSTADLVAGVWTWTDQQNLTLPASSPVDVLQGGIGFFGNFGVLNGVTILGAATNYADRFNSATTRGAMWRSTDLGLTWSLINAVGGGLVTVGATTTITAMATRNGRGVIDIWNRGTAHRNTWNNPIPVGALESGSTNCPPALAQILMGDYSAGSVRQIFGGDTTDDGTQIVWQAALKPTFGKSPQANAYFRRMVVKCANVTQGQLINAYVIVGPTVTATPRSISKVLTCPATVGLGFAGYGQGPWGTSPFGGVTENSEVDLTADLGLIGTNARPILEGAGQIIIRGIEYHVRPKPLRRVSVFT